ncbi:MAG: hypothetical protein Fur0037_10070 [Planctomycetota bacterium]
MRNFLSELWAQLKGIWARLDGGQRLVVGAVMAATVAGLSALVWFAGRPSYEVVFTANTGEELKEARRVLSQAGISFQPDSTGMSILVESSRVGAANALLNEGGLRTAGASASFGSIASVMDDSETKAANLDDRRRAQAEQAVLGLEGVLQVSILATRPKRSPFRDRDAETKPRASVSLRIRPGVPFEAVAKSAASMASAQLGVPMENVDVVDAVTYQRWTWNPDREVGGGASEFLSLQRSMSEERTRIAQGKLDAVYPGKTIVTVNVELDPNWEIRNEKIVPDQQLLKTDDLTKDESKTGSSGMASADPGSLTAENRTTATPPSNSKETRKREYATEALIGERRSGKQFPEIRRLTVALLYDKSLEQREGFDKAKFEKTVKALVGVDDSRLDSEGNPADQFSTLASEFPPPAPESPIPGPGLGDVALKWAPTVGQILGILVVILFLKGLFRRAAPAKAAAEERAEEQAENLSPEQQARLIRREIERSIASDPAALAKLLENWLTEKSA